jgi:anthranilate synthase component II
MRILVIDNYDSFVYNLVHLLYALGVDALDVVKNDRLQLEEVKTYDKILLSPGPGVPAEAGLMPELLQHYASEKPILGVCLGHQAIAESLGGVLHNMEEPLHGISGELSIVAEDYLFEGMPDQCNIGHYHSWVVSEPLPEGLAVTARDGRGQVMALRHERYDLRGVQFHPESVLTEYGSQIMKNWINQ